MKIFKVILVSVLSSMALTSAWAETQGITKNEIKLGAIEDLSGPLAGVGKQVRDGLLLRFEEINAEGGVHGRKIKLVVEDSTYDPKKAVLAAQKLTNQDKIFALLGNMGTAPNLAAFPALFKKNVINFMPLSAAREMYDPPHKLKYALLSTYYDQVRLMLPRLVEQTGANKICTMYQDDEMGQEVLRGTVDGLKTINRELVEKSSFKRGATDFSSQMQKLAAKECDLVVLGTIIRETIGGITAAKRIGFEPIFFGSTAVYSELIHDLGGPSVDGLYAAMTLEQPYADSNSESIREWAKKYNNRFNENPGFYSVIGYVIADIFVTAANKVGPDLTFDNFIKTMDGLTIPEDIFGNPQLTYSEKKRLGNEASRMSQIRNGRWEIVWGYDK